MTYCSIFCLSLVLFLSTGLHQITLTLPLTSVQPGNVREEKVSVTDADLKACETRREPQ